MVQVMPSEEVAFRYNDEVPMATNFDPDQTITEPVVRRLNLGAHVIPLPEVIRAPF